MEIPKILLYIGTLFIVISIFWEVIMEGQRDYITEKLIMKGLPTPANADVFTLQRISELKG